MATARGRGGVMVMVDVQGAGVSRVMATASSDEGEGRNRFGRDQDAQRSGNGIVRRVVLSQILLSSRRVVLNLLCWHVTCVGRRKKVRNKETLANSSKKISVLISWITTKSMRVELSLLVRGESCLRAWIHERLGQCCSGYDA